ncbi:MAG: AsmA family protein [Burkholderiaceae bacterium]|nr:AsmA family protein [Burkholderiaceae bacterium]
MRLRHLWIAMAALAGLAVLAVVVLLATFDANRYKPELIELVARRTGRTLSIDGAIALGVLPRVGLTIGAARLSGPEGKGEFAQLDSARIDVALWPLLSRRVVVERITLDGLKLEGVRYRDGRTNFDDLLPGGGGETGGKPQRDGSAAAIVIAGLQLRNATLGWRDEAADTQWRLQQANLESDRIASGEPGSIRLSGRLIGNSPMIDVALELAGDYTIDFGTLATRLSGLEVEARGRMLAASELHARLSGDLNIEPASGRFELAGSRLAVRTGDGIEATVEAPALALGAGGASGKPIDARLQVRRKTRAIDATLSVSAPTRAQQRFEFGQIRADASMTGAGLPPDGIRLSLTGHGSVDAAGRTATLALDGRADASTVRARIAATRFAPLTLRYELQADRIDVDRYRGIGGTPASASGTGSATGRTAAAPAGGAGGASAAGSAPAPTGAADAIAVPPIADLDTEGSLRVGALRAAGVEAANVVAAIRSGQGRIALTRLDAGVFGGRLDASATLAATGRHALRMKLDGVDAGQVLRSLAERDLLEGRGNLSLDVTGTGRTVSALKRSLDGTAALALRDGALAGIDLADVLQRVRGALAAVRGKEAAVERAAGDGAKTAFSSLNASFAIRNGVAHNDDLDLRSPLLRVGGSGRIDLADGTLDYVARVSVVGTLSGQGGAELAALRGVTVPVRLNGPFASLSYRVDVAGLALDTAKQALTRRLQETLTGKSAPGPAQRDKPASPRELLEGLLRR